MCQRLAMLGEDPYASDGSEALDPEVLDRLPFSTELVQDLLSATTPDALMNDMVSTEILLAGLPTAAGPHGSRVSGFAPRDRGELLPYRAGYSRASEVREYLGLSDDQPLRGLEGVIERLMGELVQAWPVFPGMAGVEAALQLNGAAAISSVERPLKSDQRFLLARALHHWLFVTKTSAPRRLLTKGHDWLQASSRAFAAELLAPARALSRRLAGGADWERHAELAVEFEVSPMVIAHQIANNRLD